MTVKCGSIVYIYIYHVQIDQILLVIMDIT